MKKDANLVGCFDHCNFSNVTRAVETITKKVGYLYFLIEEAGKDKFMVGIGSSDRHDIIVSINGDTSFTCGTKWEEAELRLIPLYPNCPINIVGSALKKALIDDITENRIK